MAKDVRVFKLINGDEIVAATIEKFAADGPRYELSKALQLIVQPTREGPRTTFVPWVLSSPDCTFTLTRQQFFVMVPATKEIEDFYLESTSGIALS